MAKILVVDDNPINLKLVSDVLQWSGHDISSATSAEEARGAVDQQHPDLILMDIALPGMDGLTLTSLLKADPRTKDIRIVALTAFAMRGDEERVLSAGCDGYLAKPIDTRRLPQQVEDYLTMRRPPE